MDLGSSRLLVELTEALGSGRQFDYAEIEAYRVVEGKQLIVDEYKFEDVMVSELLSTNATRNTLSFDYGSVSYGHAVSHDAYGEVVTSAGGHTPDGDIIDFFLARKSGSEPDFRYLRYRLGNRALTPISYRFFLKPAQTAS